jgi:hypothetical protein
MNNTNLIALILSYLPNEEIYPKCLLISKNLFNKLQPEWKQITETEHMKTKKYNYNIKKHSPKYNVKFSKILRIEKWDSDRMELFVLEVFGFPVYPNHKVGIRYTIDNWASFYDEYCYWSCNVGDREIWQGGFVLMDEGFVQEVKFAVFGIDCLGNYVWDNNNWNNYVVAKRY